MNDSVSVALSKISAVGIKLNSVAEPITEGITELERFLLKNNFAVPVWVEQSFHQSRGKNKAGHNVVLSFQLGFARDDEGNWALAARCNAETTDPSSGYPVVPQKLQIMWT